MTDRLVHRFEALDGSRRRSLQSIRPGARAAAFALAAATALLPAPAAAQSVPDGEWHAIGRDAANTKYSPLDQITADNFADLRIAWRWTSCHGPWPRGTTGSAPGSSRPSR